MNFLPMRTLATDRLVLRKLTLEDAEAFYVRLAGSETVTQYMLWQPHRDISESIASIQKVLGRYETGTCYRWAIALKETDELIGIIDLLGFDEKEESCSFAYMLGEAFWGKGYGTEAVKAAFRFAFEELGISAIIVDHFAENPASGAVMRKAGMAFQGIIPGKYEKNGIKYDAAEYHITRMQWQTGQGQP